MQRFHRVHGLWDNDKIGDLQDFHKYKSQGIKNLPQNLLALPPGHDNRDPSTHTVPDDAPVPSVDFSTEEIDLDEDLSGDESAFGDISECRNEEGCDDYFMDSGVVGFAEARSPNKALRPPLS